MAFTFDTNSIPATGAVCLFKLRTALVTAGWTQVDSGDGLALHSAGAVTSGASGASGLGNSTAWFVVRDPNSVRSFCWQRGSTNLVWRTKYSASAGFTGGSPTATQVPSATDEVVLNGGGTDAAPTFQTLFGTDGTLRFNCVAGDTTVGYAFYWDAFTSGLPSGTHYGMHLEVMAAGSFPAADTDPAVVYLVAQGNGGAGTTAPWGFDLILSEYARAFLSNTHTTGNWVQVVAMPYMDRSLNAYKIPAISAGDGVAPNPFSAKDDGFPIPWARTVGKSAPIGWKGFGSFLRWSGTNRTNYDTISNTGVNSRDKIWMNGVLLPWDGSVPLT